MADVPVGAVPAPAPAAAAPAIARRPDPVVARAAKLATVSAGLSAELAKVAPDGDTAVAPDEPAKPAAGLAGGDPKPAAAPPAEAKKPAEPAKAADKPAPAAPADEPPDEKTAKSLAAIDRRAKAFRDEQASEKAKLDLERVELARLKAEVESRGASLDDLRKLAKRDPISLLAKLGIETEDEWEQVGRGAYPRTKSGKADPKAAPAVAQTARERELEDRLSMLAEQQDRLIEHLRARDTKAQSESFVTSYLDSAVKAIPETPTLIGKLHGKAPGKAREALLALGAVMEREAAAAEGTKKYDPSHTPSHAELIARYEKDRRAELEEQGVDVEALLAAKPTTPAAAPGKKPAATLDPTATAGTQPISGNPTREQKLASVSAGLKKLDAAQN